MRPLHLDAKVTLKLNINYTKCTHLNNRHSGNDYEVPSHPKAL